MFLLRFTVGLDLSAQSSKPSERMAEMWLTGFSWGYFVGKKRKIVRYLNSSRILVSNR